MNVPFWRAGCSPRGGSGASAMSGGWIVFCGVLLTTILGVSGFAQGGANLAPNPDFLDGSGDGRPDGWDFNSDGQSGSFELVGDSGKRVARITSEGGAPFLISGGWDPERMIEIEPGEPVVLRARVRAAASESIAQVSVTYRNAENDWVASSSSGELEPDDGWQEVAVRDLVPSGARYAQVILRTRAGAAEFSDVRLGHEDWLSEVEPGGEKMFFINMDYNDMVKWPDRLRDGLETYREPEIADFFERCAEMGVDGVLWRVSILGQVAYQSQVRTVFPGRADRSLLDEQHLDLADILETMDPLEVAIREARKHDIAVYVWVTISDEMSIREEDMKRHSSDFILDNPEYALLSREGEPFLGTLCYNEPAVREHRLDQIRELVEYGADGIYLCTRTHAFYHDTDDGMKYGYNPPIVEEYERRYGVNILEEDFDKDAWLDIRAAGLTQFMGEAAEIVHGADQKLWLGIKSTRHEDRGWPYGDAKLPWVGWLQSGWLDGVVSGHYYTPIGEIPSQAAAFEEVARPDQTVILWQQLWHYQESRFTPIEDLVRQVKMIATTSIDGGTYHEAHNIESRPVEAYWQPLADAIAAYWREPGDGASGE